MLSRSEVVATTDAIAAVQRPDGAIPWYPGGHTDPWDHVECAMALSLDGRTAAAERAYRWLARVQRPDGSWPAAERNGLVEQPHVETNFCAYLAAGVWLHHEVTGDAGFVEELWPAVERATDLVIDEQQPGGEIGWAVGDPMALLTSCSSILTSLHRAVDLAAIVGQERLDWELAAELLADAIANRPDAFSPRERFSMDWYYPVLSGAVDGRRLDDRWRDFVVEGLGARCVADQPWVTTAETCELAMALVVAGRQTDAAQLLADIQHLRQPDGSYLTGRNFILGVSYPYRECSTWSSAAVVLACDALADGPARRLFRTAPTVAVPDHAGAA